MWRLRMRGNEIREWVEVGEFENIDGAAQRVLQLEGRPGALFFRVYADPLSPKSDAEILCRLEYQSEKSFYLLTRRMQ
jgi:hypothetical protein